MRRPSPAAPRTSSSRYTSFSITSKRARIFSRGHSFSRTPSRLFNKKKKKTLRNDISPPAGAENIYAARCNGADNIRESSCGIFPRYVKRSTARIHIYVRKRSSLYTGGAGGGEGGGGGKRAPLSFAFLFSSGGVNLNKILPARIVVNSWYLEKRSCSSCALFLAVPILSRRENNAGARTVSPTGPPQ